MGFLGSLFGNRLDYFKRFNIVKEGISGTMSKFYEVTDRKTGETFGLKIIDPDKMHMVEDRYKKMDKRAKKPSEGEIAIMFDHPYIVKTFEQGFTTDGRPYLLMEFLEGTGLNNILMLRQDLLAGARLKYMRQCAEALQAVHDKGFIHRDFCPRNLLFSGDGLSLKLIDFGLTVPNRSPFTDPGNRTGTANYMAPELIRRKQTDQRVDIFAFGVTMYELFAKQLPWPGTSGGLGAMSHDQPPVPLQTIRPNVNPLIAEGIHRCLTPDPRDRFSSMKDFLLYIRRAQNEDRD